MVSNLFIGDNGQLHPFTVTARKMQLMPQYSISQFPDQ